MTTIEVSSLEEAEAKLLMLERFALAQCTKVMTDHGATDSELNAALAWQRQQCEQQRIKVLGEMKRWLDEPCAPSHELQ